jgi:hypothetical protein
VRKIRGTAPVRPYDMTLVTPGPMPTLLAGTGGTSEVAVRPEGANHQWRKIPPGELSIDPSSRALPKFESYAAFEKATFFGLKSNPATERFHGIDRLVHWRAANAPFGDWHHSPPRNRITWENRLRSAGRVFQENRNPGGSR